MSGGGAISPPANIPAAAINTATPTTTSVVAPPAYDETYAYDAISNLTSKAGVTRTYGATGSGTGAGPHQARTVDGATYTYDANGNLQSGGGRTFTWNADNLPASVTSGGTTKSYLYDADGERVAKNVGGMTTPADESAGWHSPSPLKRAASSSMLGANGALPALRVARKHARQAFGTRMPRIRVPRDSVPGRGAGGAVAPCRRPRRATAPEPLLR